MTGKAFAASFKLTTAACLLALAYFAAWNGPFGSRYVPASHFPQRHAAVTLPQPDLSEFDKLDLILNKYRSAEVKIITGGLEYKPQDMWLKVRGFLVQSKSSIKDAEDWIREYCYRISGGEVIYFKYPDGKMLPVRDVFLRELAGLNQAR